MKPLKWEEIKLESASRRREDGVVILRALVDKGKYEKKSRRVLS